MSRKKGFTLVELLVVISIIALLVAILLPSLNRAKEIAYRMKCGTNLSAIGKAMVLYYRTYASYPMLDVTGQESGPVTYRFGKWGTPGNTAVYTGFNRQQRPDLSMNYEYCITALPWMLVRDGNESRLFVCPSDTDAKPQPSVDLKYIRPDGSEDYCWDFSSHVNISYSYQSAHQGVAYPPNLIIMADKTPVYSIGNQAYQVGWSGAMTPEQKALNMSQNHKGESINVMYADGRVMTNQTRADINDLTNPRDCIYTWYAAVAQAASSINVSDAQPMIPGDDWFEGNIKDSFLHGPYRGP